MTAGVLLIGPFVALLWVPSYAHRDPQLWGIPFFFWYQFLWVIASSITTACAYLVMAPLRAADRPAGDDGHWNRPRELPR